MTASPARCEDVVAIWAAQVGVAASDELYDAAASDPEIQQLATYPDAELRRSLEQAIRRVGSKPTWRDWLDVLEQVANATTALGHGTRLLTDAALPSRLQATELVEARRLSLSRDRIRLPYDEATIDEAFDVLRRRIGEGEANRHALKRRAPRWRVPPSRQLRGAPTVETTTVEAAIVAILSATVNPWQFSSTPDGRMFTGRSLGYHHESERTYVAGLSDVLDTTAGVIETHRAGLGGRVYLWPQYVECADCKLVVAWLGEVGHRATAFGACTVRKSARGAAATTR